MTAGALLLAVAAVAAAAAGPVAPTPASPRVLVQTDGARVAFASPPVLRDGRWVGRLAGSGTLVSVPAARVDAAATARANVSGGEPPAPRPTAAPRPFETPPLGDRARLRTSPEEASRVLDGTRRGTPAPPPTPGGEKAAEGASQPVPEEPKDALGRDEAWWRERAGVVRGEYEAAVQRLAVAEARLEAAERDYLGPSEAERNTFVLRIQEQRALVEEARQEHARASSAWEALQEEARKSGAFPGWLR